MSTVTGAEVPQPGGPAFPGPRVFFEHEFTPFAKADIHQSIGARFEQQARAHAGRLAVKTASGELTYRELNEFANRVARAILATNPSSTRPVALLMEQDESLIAAILGVLKTGRPYVPLDPSFGAGRNRLVLEDSQADLLVTDRAGSLHARELIGRQFPVLHYDDIGRTFPGENVGIAVSPDAIAYILYTSGSTGQPKGVFQNHRNVLHNTLKTTNGLRISSSDRLTLLASCAFAASVSDLFGSLLNGAALFPFNLREQGLAKLGDWLSEQQITVYHSVPTVFRHFMASLDGHEDFSRVRLVKLGGEPVLRRDHDLYKHHFPLNCVFHVNLGSTEMNVVRQFFATHDTHVESSVLPIGYEVDDTQVLLLDDAGREVGFQREGEIVIRSPYLACGYWRKPELTEAAFQPDPQNDAVRTYRSGDLGWLLPDGCLYHLGRKDFQVKIRGHRIEVAEVETALHEAAEVKEAAVVGRETKNGDKELVAYIIPRPGTRPTPGGLRDFLRGKMPDYMVPTVFVVVETLPLTSTGKIDRHALPSVESARLTIGTEFVAPRSPTEEKVAQIYAEVLGLDRVGVHDDFLELGGQSLAAMRLVARLRRSFEVALPVRALFESLTVEEIARRIDEERCGEHGTVSGRVEPWSFLVPIQSKGNHKPLFIVPGGGGGEDEFVVYARLARHLGQDYSCYGLMARGSDGRQAPHDSVQEMATDYVKEIRAFQPEGPYFLLGECIGGIVAYEMAQQLRAAGREVALLVMLDTPRPSAKRRTTQRIRSACRHTWEQFRDDFLLRVPHHLRQLRGRGWRGQCAYLLDKAAKSLLAIAYILRLKRIPLTDDRLKKRSHVEQVRFEYPRKLLRHEPKPYPGDVVFLINEDWAARKKDLDWSDLVGGARHVRRLSGNHTSYIREHGAETAAELRRCLEHARGDRITLQGGL